MRLQVFTNKWRSSNFSPSRQLYSNQPLSLDHSPILQT
jgi:hypothetical protein